MVDWPDRIKEIRRVEAEDSATGEEILEYTLVCTGKELLILKALCQNPHPNYEDSLELMAFAEKFFNDMRQLGI